MLDQADNLMTVPNKPYLYVKLKRTTFQAQGPIKERYLVKVCSRFNQVALGSINQKIPLLGVLNEDKNSQSDTFTCELFMKADQEAKDEGATPIGECYIPYKLCFLPENTNQWLDYRCVLSDRKGLLNKMLTGQLSVRVRFVQLGTENSSFNLDGTKRDKRAVLEDFFKNKVEQMIDLQRYTTNNKVEETQPADSQQIVVAKIPTVEDGFDE